jgi:hypothetical protein
MGLVRQLHLWPNPMLLYSNPMILPHRAAENMRSSCYPIQEKSQ